MSLALTLHPKAAVVRDSVQNTEAFVTLLVDSPLLLPELPLTALVHTACKFGAAGCLRMLAAKCPPQLAIPNPEGQSSLQVVPRRGQ